MNTTQSRQPVSRDEIATLVDHHRDGRFIFAFCPVCDHAAESEDTGDGREQTASRSVAKIETHLKRIHRKPVALKITIKAQS